MNELIPDKKAYQVNKQRMAWSALLIMAVTTIATIADPARMSEADSMIMAMYISLSGLVASYLGFSGMVARKDQEMK